MSALWITSNEVFRSVLPLEFVFRSEGISVWHGRRTIAVMDRLSFASLLLLPTVFVVHCS